MASLRPYLHLDGTAREAMEFYKGILGGELEIQTVGETKWAMEMPEMANVPRTNVMHSTLTKGDWILMAADMADPSSFKKGDTVSLCLVCDSKDEIESVYKKLSAGGDIFMALDHSPFGWFSMLTDKFGTEWMLQYEEKS